MISSKLMGAVLIISCGLVTGLSINMKSRKRLAMLQDFASFLHEIMLEIEFSVKSLPEITAESKSDFAKCVSHYLEEGQDFREAWIKSAQEFETNADRSFVISVFEEFGSTGFEGEKEKTERAHAHCLEIIKTAKENLQKKGRIQAVLPLYAAITVLLILL